MSMNKDTVKKVARLARIKMEDEELERMGHQLNGILSWIEQLQEVDTENVAPLRSVVDTSLKLREDVVNDGGIPEDVLKNAPEETQGFFVVPKVVE